MFHQVEVLSCVIVTRVASKSKLWIAAEYCHNTAPTGPALCCKCYHNTLVISAPTEGYTSSDVKTPGLPLAPESLTVVQPAHSQLPHIPGHHTLQLPSILCAGYTLMICIRCMMLLSPQVLQFKYSAFIMFTQSNYVHWICHQITNNAHWCKEV